MFDGLRLALIRRLETLTGTATTSPALPVVDGAAVERLRAQGNALIAEAAFEEAESLFREALTLTPDDTRLLVCLGYVLKEQNQLAAARVALRRAAYAGNTDPQAFEAHYLLGEISELQGDLDDAIRHFTATLNAKPDFNRACEDVLRLLKLQGRGLHAKAFIEKQILLYPDNADYRLLLAKLCTDAFDLSGTVEHLMAAVAMGVNEVRICIILGAALCRLERGEEARRYFEMAETADPTVIYETRYHQGYFHTRSGNSRAAVELLEKSIEHQPDYVPSHSLLLLNLSHASTELNRSYREAAERFASAIESPDLPIPATSTVPIGAQSKTLRIGFVTGEFREHPVLHFLVGVLEHIDKSQFHLVAFSNNQIDDSSTNVFKALFADWHDIQQLSHDEVAKLVHTQHIDVLIDLSGHTGDARLPVFARKPALVQVAWLGYFASTGLTSMDYIIADTVCVPDDSQEWFSETVVRLPDTRLCMTVPKTSRAIPTAPSPCKTKGYVTFGSFQQASKLNDKVLRVWATVLAAVPQSRLRIQNKSIDSLSIRNRICANMVLAGIDLARVELVGAMGMEDYLEAHCNVDILLDTFPYTGGTTTAFALWMGVPTVTLAGDTMISLQGVSMLTCVGLTDWVAKDETAFVEIAQRFSNDPEALERLRNQLREKTLKSPLFDSARFAVNLQNALRAMYQEKLAKAQAAADSALQRLFPHQ